jgi:hypothetical protein
MVVAGRGCVEVEAAYHSVPPSHIGHLVQAQRDGVFVVAADARTAVTFALSPGLDHDAPHGQALLEELVPARSDFGFATCISLRVLSFPFGHSKRSPVW